MNTGEILQKALLADPDDLAAHAAYADWLSQQGDPRGEFIQVQLLLEDPSRPAAKRKDLQEREKKLLAVHSRQWLGGLADFLLGSVGVYQFRFARGWLDTLQVSDLTVAFARALAKAPETRLLRRLQIEREKYEAEGEFESGPDIPEDTYHPSVHALSSCQFLGNLRVFQLGEVAEVQYPNCHTSGETAVELVAKMPHLEELYLLAHHVHMERLFRLNSLNNLRVLQIYHCHRYPLELLAGNPAFANLTHLLLYPHALEPDDEEPYINQAGVRSLLESKHLKKLTHLRLRSSDLGDEGCAEMAASGLLGQLKLLDLMNGVITDDGARTLAGCPALKNLDLLEVSYNRLTQAGIRTLQAAGVKVQAENQYEPDSDDMEYLWMGDME